MKVGSTSGRNTTYTVDGLVQNTSYSFRVIAENEIGYSEPLETEAAVLAKPLYSK
jgi:hypothetical protein